MINTIILLVCIFTGCYGIISLVLEMTSDRNLYITVIGLVVACILLIISLFIPIKVSNQFEVINDYECVYWYYNTDGELVNDYECGIDKSELESIARNITENLRDKGCEVTEICFTPVTTYIPNR